MFTIERNPCSLAQTGSRPKLRSNRTEAPERLWFSIMAWRSAGLSGRPPALPRRQPLEELAAIASTAAAAESERRSAISPPDPTALADLAQHRAPVGRIRLQCGCRRRSVSAERPDMALRNGIANTRELGPPGTDSQPGRPPGLKGERRNHLRVGRSTEGPRAGAGPLPSSCYASATCHSHRRMNRRCRRGRTQTVKLAHRNLACLRLRRVGVQHSRGPTGRLRHPTRLAQSP
jgi:hypothetical protein